VLSIIGGHAGEKVDDIVGRKCRDVVKVGSTLWVYQSSKACVGDVQNFGKAYGNPAVYFLEGSAQSDGTKHRDEASEKSADGKNWEPVGLRNVKGKLPGSALVL